MSIPSTDTPAEDAPATDAGEGDVFPAVTPFWERMPRLFAFPLQRAALQRNVLATLAFCVVLWLALPQLPQAPVRSIALLLLGWISTSLYVAGFAFLVIERSSVGYLDTRDYPRGEPSAHPFRPVKMFFVVVFVPVAIAVLGALGLPGPLVLVALLLFALLLPASVMVLTMTDSFAEAVNPGRCAGVALGIGPPYLLLCLFLFMLSVSSRQAIALLFGGHAAVPGAGTDLQAVRGTLLLSIFAFTLVQNYFLVLTCALIGYAMYQYSAALGIAVVGPGDTRRPGGVSAATHGRRVREALIGKMIEAGEFREALELLSDELRQRPNDLSLHVRLHALLLQEGSRPRIEDHAARYLELLLAAGSLKEALALFQQTREMFPEFLPREPAHLPQLASAAIDVPDPKLAALLVRGFDKKYPGHPSIPEVYVVGARILLLTGRTREAKALFQHVNTTYPHSAAADQARRFLARFGPATAAPPTQPAASARVPLTGPPARPPAPAPPAAVPPPVAVRPPAPPSSPAPLLAPARAAPAVSEPEYMVEDVPEPGPQPDIFLEAEPEAAREPEVLLEPAPAPEPVRRPPPRDSAPPSYIDLVLDPGEPPANPAPPRR